MIASPNRLSGLGTLLACQALLVAGLAFSYPFFALYLHRERGLSMGVVGLIMSAMFASTAVAQAFAGELSDLRGPKFVMEGAVASRAVLSAAIAWALACQASVAVLAALLILAGFCGNFFDSGIRAWIADHCPAMERPRVYGYQRIAVNLGWAVGPAVGGLLAETSYASMFAATAAIAAVCWAALHWKLRLTSGRRAHETFSPTAILAASADRRFLRFCAFTMTISLVMAQLVVSLSVHAVNFVGISEKQVGLLFALNGLIVTLVQAQVPRMIDGRRLTAALSVGCVLYAAGYSALGWAAGFAALAAAVAVVTLGEALVSPTMQSIAVNLAPDRYRGRYVGLHGLSFQIGFTLGPLLGGLGLQHLSPRHPALPWALVGLLALTAAAGFARFGRLLAPQEQGLSVVDINVAPMEV